jgi:hypothetical protein
MTRLLISIVAVQVLILWALRPVVWWYFGIDRGVHALEDIAESLRTLPTVRRHDYASGRKPLVT